MKNKILILAIVFAVYFIFTITVCQAASPTQIEANTYITLPTEWKKANSPYIIKGPVYVQAELTIEPGTIVKFDYTPSYHAGRLEIYDKFTAIGTEDERIIFTSGRDDSFGGDTNKDGYASNPAAGDWWHINFYTQKSVEMKYVSVFYGGGTAGYVDGAISVNNSDNVSVKKTEIKYCSNYGIWIINSRPIIENNTIANNDIGISAEGSKTPIVTNNSIVGNNAGARVSSPLMYRLDAKNNWWGSRTGPYYKSNYGWADNQKGKGNLITDGVYFNPWLDKDPNYVRKPVVLIPGIGGTVNWDLMLGKIAPGKWTLMSHTYDGLIEAFRNMGYEEGKDFFICYYDWRQKNADSAKDYLAPLISKANNLNGTTEVNIVAHSMGGILARSYIQGDEYANDVDNLIMIGTPNKGSSDVYPVWEGGYIPKNWETRILLMGYLDYLRVKNITPSAYQSVQQYIPSVKELMPVYSYLHPKGDPENLKNFSSMEETNDILLGLNNEINSLNQKVKVSTISGNSQSTVNTIPIIETEDDPLWLDGKPDPIDPERNDIRGDKRVLLSSSEIENVVPNIINFDHGDIVSQSAQIVASRFGEEVDKIFESPVIDNELAFWFASPVDVEIKDPDGRTITKEFNNIDNGLAQYSGESKPDGFKYISIPNPKKGNYEIKLTGNGNGEYHAGSIYADYENETADQESGVDGTISAKEAKEYKINYDPQNIDDPVGELAPSDTTPPAIVIASPENQKTYFNDQIVPVDYTITDDVSRADKIAKTIEYDGQPFIESQIDLSLQKLGGHTLKITAIDETGNKSEQLIAFQNTTSLNAIQNNLNHYSDLKLVKNKVAKEYFSVRLKNLKNIFNLLEEAKKSNLKPKLKQIAVNALKTVINADISLLVKQINSKYPHWIDQGAASFLIEDLNSLRP